MRRWSLALGALLGLDAIAGGAVAREITPEQAPAAWVSYATDATESISGWLNAETAPAPRVRAALDAARPAPDQPTPPLVVKLWVDRRGTITRTDFPTLGDSRADEDLHALLDGRKLPPPPRGIRLPMRVALQLPPPPPSPASAADAAPTGATLH